MAQSRHRPQCFSSLWYRTAWWRKGEESLVNMAAGRIRNLAWQEDQELKEQLQSYVNRGRSSYIIPVHYCSRFNCSYLKNEECAEYITENGRVFCNLDSRSSKHGNFKFCGACRLNSTLTRGVSDHLNEGFSFLTSSGLIEQRLWKT